MPWNHKIHSRIVEDDTDLEGIVTYHLYKNDKKDWILEKHHRNGKVPTAHDIDSNYHHQTTDNKIQSFRTQAKQIVSNYREIVIAESLRIQRDAVLDGISSATTQALEKHKITPARTIGMRFGTFVGNVLAGIFATAIVAVIYTMFWLNEARLSGKSADEALCAQTEQAIQARNLLKFDCKPLSTVSKELE